MMIEKEPKEFDFDMDDLQNLNMEQEELKQDFKQRKYKEEVHDNWFQAKKVM